MHIRVTDAEGFEQLSQEADLVIVTIQRADIEGLRVGSAVERLLLLSDNAEQVRRFAGRMLVLVEGYDEDPRPLLLIPECVRFFRAVTAQWNYWLHFLLPLPDQLTLIVLMQVDVQPAAHKEGLDGFALREPGQLGAVLHGLFGAMNTLHDTYGIPPAHGEAMTEAVVNALGLPG